MDGLPWTVSSQSQRRLIEGASLALVRDYLQQSGLVATLSKLDEEAPKTPKSICNRAELAQTLHIAPLLRRNSNLIKPFNSVIETLVWSVLQSPQAGYLSSSRPSSANPTGLILVGLIVCPLLGYFICVVRLLMRDRKASVMRERSADYRPQNEVVVLSSIKVESASKSDKSSLKASKVRKVTIEEPRKKVRIEEPRPRMNSFTLKDLDKVDDLEDKCLRWLSGYNHLLGVDLSEDTDAASSKTQGEKATNSSAHDRHSPRQKKVGFKITKTCQPLDLETAKRLRKLIFGPTYSRNFHDPWLKQAFTFRDCNDDRTERLRYGLIQKKGGPCGLVAIVQGLLLKYLIYEKVGNNGSHARHRDQNVLNVKTDLRTCCLAESIVEILWRAGGEHRAIVATLGACQSFKALAGFPTDGVTEYVVLTQCDSLESLHSMVYKHITHFEYGHGSVISLLYSVILSRGINEILFDMDDRSNVLLGKNYCCTPELLNLFLFGYAFSNMFDDQKVVATIGAVHRGVTSQSDIGFLSVDPEESELIGSNLDRPSYPIWIVAKENHFCVLFGLHRDIADDKLDVFELHYYDGLSHQDREMKLTVDRTQKTPKSERVLMSALDNCIMRRWRKAGIEWHVINPS